MLKKRKPTTFDTNQTMDVNWAIHKMIKSIVVVYN